MSNSKISGVDAGSAPLTGELAARPATHSEGPWHANLNRSHDRAYPHMIVCADEGAVALVALKGDAAFIVKAANCHQPLVDGCNAMLGLVQLLLARDDLTPPLRRALESNHRIGEARAALAKAES